jgi:hypothetical protein
MSLDNNGFCDNPNCDTCPPRKINFKVGVTQPIVDVSGPSPYNPYSSSYDTSKSHYYNAAKESKVIAKIEAELAASKVDSSFESYLEDQTLKNILEQAMKDKPVTKEDIDKDWLEPIPAKKTNSRMNSTYPPSVRVRLNPPSISPPAKARTWQKKTFTEPPSGPAVYSYGTAGGLYGSATTTASGTSTTDWGSSTPNSWGGDWTANKITMSDTPKITVTDEEHEELKDKYSDLLESIIELMEFSQEKNQKFEKDLKNLRSVRNLPMTAAENSIPLANEIVNFTEEMVEHCHAVLESHAYGEGVL